ncbi:CHAT domain-containing protein [Micromonospora sp. HM5-17]|jgi:hypothetical protein|uniref:CHAT domain-containing protein n=1 Tax=Micromonospora sp. HM5-17 TaxID=2487710 RepID=UPI000F498D12|nr:CHAT domain-containing protein [Micromonospora sp. HM5-17]ROT31954.1 CHAT domain-containing protein [Micromonospora sp. HM5-17]
MTERTVRPSDADAASAASVDVDRALARDDLLQLARDAEQAVGIVRQRESLARRAENEPDVFGLALRHYLAETSSRRRAIRAQAWSYAATIVCFCERLGIPVSSPHPAEEMYAFAAEELDGAPGGVLGGDGLDHDLTLGVFNTYQRARNLRLHGRYAEALQLVVVPAEELFGTGAEPHLAHYLYETGACLIAAGQAAQVPSALGERDRYWTETRAAGFSTRHRLDLVRGLAAWRQGDHPTALRGLRSALRQLRAAAHPPDPVTGVLRSWLDEARAVHLLSVTLSLAELLAAVGRDGDEPDDPGASADADRRREAIILGGQALAIAERIRGRWRVIARSRAPLAVVFRRVYGDIALLAARVPGQPAARLGLRVALSAKQTGFASRIREGRLLMSPHLGGLLDEVINAEDPPVASFAAGDEAAREERLEHLRFRLEEEVSPMLADTVLPARVRLRRLLRTLGRRHALDVVALPDTLGGGRTNWFRSLVRPDRRISFERFTTGAAYQAFFEGSADQPPWLGRLREAAEGAGPDWYGLAREILPAALVEDALAATVDRPIELLISAHSALSLLPWAALRLDPDTALVERAVIAQCPVLTCLSDRRLPPVTGSALVRLVSTAEQGVDVVQERLAWDLPEEHGRVPLSRCVIGPDSAPVPIGGDLPSALADAPDDVRFLHVASHGGGRGLAQYLLLPERLLAAQALAMTWPTSVLIASCHVGRLVNPEDAEPLNFVMALLTGGSRCVVAAIDEVPDVRTSRMTAQIVDAVREGPVRLDVALREVQLAYPKEAAPTWALLAAYVR